jgi:hypothetical protein
MRSLVDNIRVLVIERTNDYSYHKNGMFVFNLVRNNIVFRAIRITLVQALGMINGELELFDQFKWEELNTKDYLDITSTTYFSVGNVQCTLLTWICSTDLIVGKDIIVKLTTEEANNLLTSFLYELKGDILYSPDCSQIIRNEVEPTKPLVFNSAKWLPFSVDTKLQKGDRIRTDFGSEAIIVSVNRHEGIANISETEFILLNTIAEYQTVQDITEKGLWLSYSYNIQLQRGDLVRLENDDTIYSIAFLFDKKKSCRITSNNDCKIVMYKDIEFYKPVQCL